MMGGCRPLRGLSHLLQRSWGSAPLHPRLSAIAALRGLNANSSATCSEFSRVYQKDLSNSRRTNGRNEGTHSPVVLSTGLPLDQAAGINRVWFHLVDRLRDVLRGQATSKKQSREKISRLPCDSPIAKLARATKCLSVEGIKHDCLNIVVEDRLGFEL